MEKYIIDFFIIIFALISIIINYKKGIIKSIISAISLVLALAVSVMVYKPITEFVIKYTAIDDYISDTISKKTIETIDQSTINNQIIANLRTYIDQNQIDKLANDLTAQIIKIVVFYLIYLIARICLKFFGKILNVLDSIPIIKQLNHLLGGVYGAFIYLVILELIFATLNVIFVINPNNKVINLIDQSYIGKVLYDNNFLSAKLKE